MYGESLGITISVCGLVITTGMYGESLGITTRVALWLAKND